MNSTNDESKYNAIKEIIDNYLRKNQLSKTACLTNIPLNKFDRAYLVHDFNYICFCVSNYLMMSQILFAQHFLLHKKIPFDVFISSPHERLDRRVFGYVYLLTNNAKIGLDVLQYISANKININRHSSILLRLVSEHDEIMFASLPNNIFEILRLSKNEIIAEIRS